MFFFPSCFKMYTDATRNKYSRALAEKLLLCDRLSFHNLDHLGFHPRKIPIYSYLLRPGKTFPPSVEGYIMYRSLFFKSTGLSTCHYNIYVSLIMPVCWASLPVVSLWWWSFVSWARNLSFQRHYWLCHTSLGGKLLILTCRVGTTPKSERKDVCG